MTGNPRRLCLWRVAPALAVILLSLCGSSMLWAQGTSYFTGYVQDPTGVFVPAAQLVIVNTRTSYTLTLKTDASWLYRTPAIDPGTYNFAITKEGFQKLESNGVELLLAQPRGINFTLQVGAVTQAIQVSAAAPLLTTEDAGLGQNVTAGQIEDLPFFNRSAGILVQLSPGIRYLGEDFISYGGSRFNGNGIGNTNILLDGVNIQDDRLDVDQEMCNPTVDALSEVRVVQNQYSAEFGRDVGMLIMMQSKQGTNSYHGTLYEYARNEAMDTYNGFTPGAHKPYDREYISGGTLGGRIWRDKAFFFASVDDSINHIPYAALLTIPTVKMKTGDFSDILNQASPQAIYDPAGGPANRPQFNFGGVLNKIDPGREDPIGKNVLHYYPDPNRPGVVQNLGAAGNADNKVWKSTDRIDWNISDTDRFFGVYNQHYDVFLDNGFSAWRAIDPGAAAPYTTGEAGGFKIESTVWDFHEDHTFSPTLFSSVAFSYKPRWDRRLFAGINPSKHYAETIGIKNYPGARLPQSMGGDLGFPLFNFADGGYRQIGPGFLEFAESPMTVYDFQPSLTYVHGRHTWKIGFQTERGEHGAPNQGNPTGTFNFSRIATSSGNVAQGAIPAQSAGDSEASLFLGLVNTGGGALGPELIWREYYYSLFGQDDVKLTPKLTLNFGWRWDIDAPVYEELNRGSGFAFGPMNPVSGTRGIVTYLCGTYHTGCGYYNTDWHRYAPRFGFAYAINPKTTFRGGFGIYDMDPGLGANTGAPNLGYTTSFSIGSPDGGFTPAFFLQNGFPDYPLGYPYATHDAGFGAVPAANIGSNPSTGPGFVDPYWKFGRTMNFNISIQRELPGNMVFEIAGQGVLGRNLMTSMNWNEVPPALWGLAGSNVIRRPFPQYTSVTQQKDANGLTDYWAGYIRIEKHMSHGLSLIGNLSYNKTIGIMSSSIYYRKLSRGPTFYAQDNGPGGQSPVLGLISFDYKAPWGPGTARLNHGPAAKAFGGWDIAGIYTLRSGNYFTPGSGIDSTNGNSPLSGRVNRVGDPLANIPGGRHADEWFNPTAFAKPASQSGQIGGYCCGGLRTPSNFILNLSIGKNTAVTEHLTVRFTAEFFNFTNTIPFGTPDTNLSSTTVGRIFGPLTEGANTIGGNGQRVTQLGLHIVF